MEMDLLQVTAPKTSHVRIVTDKLTNSSSQSVALLASTLCTTCHQQNEIDKMGKDVKGDESMKEIDGTIW